MQRAEIAAAIKLVSKLTGEFKLRSGKTADTYFDKYLFESDPKLLWAVANEMQKLVPSDTEVLCGLELGGVPVVTVLSQLTGLRAAFIRKKPKEHGTCKYAEGPSLINKRVLIVEDVVSSGGQIVESVNMMRADGVVVERAIAVIDRRPEGATALEDNGIALSAAFTMKEIEGA